MSAIGPALPQDLIDARKRKRAEGDATELDPSIADIEAQVSHTGTSGTKDDLDDTVEQEEATVYQEIDSDDDIGPMLPDPRREAPAQVQIAKPEPPLPQAPASTSSRPDWMLKPPSSKDWHENMDTTKLKSRTFATSRPGRPSPSTDLQKNEKWTDIPGSSTNVHKVMDSKSDSCLEHQHKTQAEFPSQNLPQKRGESLYITHNDKRRKAQPEEDDVSKRSFDREKDIVRNTSLQKTNQMAKSAKNMTSMFDTGRYL